MLGIQTQETKLGLYNGKEVVIIRDFLKEDEVFVPFNGVGDSSLENDKEKYQYTYEEIMHMLKDNTKLTSMEKIMKRTGISSRSTFYRKLKRFKNGVR